MGVRMSVWRAATIFRVLAAFFASGLILANFASYRHFDIKIMAVLTGAHAINGINRQLMRKTDAKDLGDG